MSKTTKSRASRDVLAERERQKSVEGFAPAHDDGHNDESLAFAAACYVTADANDAPPAVWPWGSVWWKPKDRRGNLVRAGALILAEIERLDRAKAYACANAGTAACVCKRWCGDTVHCWGTRGSVGA